MINYFKLNPDAVSRLICFPWAGGGSIHYARWGNVLNSSIEGNTPGNYFISAQLLCLLSVQVKPCFPGNVFIYFFLSPVQCLLSNFQAERVEPKNRSFRACSRLWTRSLACCYRCSNRSHLLSLVTGMTTTGLHQNQNQLYFAKHVHEECYSASLEHITVFCLPSYRVFLFLHRFFMFDFNIEVLYCFWSVLVLAPS